MDPAIGLQLVTLAVLAACVGLVLSGRRRPPASPARPSWTEAEERATTLEQRVQVLELERPKFVAEMNGLVDECLELLERTKRKKAALDGGKRGNPNGSPDVLEQSLDQNLEPLDGQSLRSLGKAAVAKRFGML